MVDLLIVGGGPAGTAAAFRAQELGIDALVVEFDDLMKRIRDYSKDKLILPGFGGGDRMRFPKGDELISRLPFGPIDKDDLCASWKALYQKEQVPSRVGVELTALEQQSDGSYRATVWDHPAQREDVIHARFVVLALGRGVPRTFDIPGNVEGVRYQLRDPQAYLGKPACVIGGGTSAAEAVIALSNAKIAAQDPTSVYWSYRGDRLPRVSRALAEAFFTAYVGNGNIRYQPRSEPTAVVTAEDHREYLAIRTDRRCLEGRPQETTQLEFPKESCIACIGEDLPEGLLASIGIPMVVGGPRRRKRIVVTRHLESVQPNVFLAGDILSQAHFVTEDFEADPKTFQEVKHRGNIKAALRDGVLIAEILRRRLDGRDESDVQVVGAEEVATEGAVPAVGNASAAPPERIPVPAGAFLIRALPGGVEGEEYSLPERAVTTLGKAHCDIIFPEDTTLSDQHASIAHGDDGYTLRDDGSTTGVFLKVPVARKLEVKAGDLLRVGRQFLLFSKEDGQAAFTQYRHTGESVGCHQLPRRSIVLGRRAPDITLDADDKTLSRRHLAIAFSDGRILVKDLKSVNGTYVRVRDAYKLHHGDQFRAGQQLFTFSLQEDAVLDAGQRGEEAPSESVATVEPSDSTGEAPTVLFTGAGLGSGRTCPLQGHPSLCAVAEAEGVPITAECHSGICGSDPIRILAGGEYLEPPGAQERETLEDLCDLEPGEYRLACMVRAKGPVRVEIL